MDDGFTRSLQENLISLLCHSDQHGKLIASNVQPEMFEGDYRTIATEAIDYWRTQNKAPKMHTADMLAHVLEDSSNRRAASLRRILLSMQRIFDDGINAQYVLNQLTIHKRSQQLKTAILQAAEQINDPTGKTVPAVEDLLSEIVRARRVENFDGGVRLSDYEQVLQTQQLDDEFDTGIRELDSRHVVPARGRIYNFLAPTGYGKCLALGTLVMRYDGRLVPVESVQTGDLLMGPDSKPRKVVSICKGTDHLYQIVPVKGKPWVCNETHILTLVNSVTGQIIDIPLNEYLTKSKNFKHLHKLFAPEKGVDFPKQHECPIPPYFLGLWIGDGTKRATRVLGEVAITKPDKEVQSACEQVATQYGLHVRKNINDGGCPTWTLTGTMGKQNVLLNQLREFWKEQKIPHAILTASRSYRKELLAGIIDSDGHLAGGCVEITQKNSYVAEGITFLARSLGLFVSVSDKHVNGVCYKRLTLAGHLSQIPTRIARKTAQERRQIKRATRTGFSVVPMERGPYAGFTLDGDGRFLLEDFTVTHNSWWLVGLGKRAILRRKKVLHVTLEQSQDEVLHRYYQSMFAASKRDGKYAAAFLKFDEDNKVSGRDMARVRPQFTLASPLLRDELESRIRIFGQRMHNMVIKAFPQRSLTFGGLQSYLDLLETVEGFEPDLLIIDYPKLMKMDTRDPRVALGTLYSDLKGMLQERNIAGCFVHQTSKLGAMARNVRTTHVAEDWSVIHTSDVVITFSATDQERGIGMARLFIDKSRTEASGGFEIIVTQSYDTGQFFLTSGLKTVPQQEHERMMGLKTDDGGDIVAEEEDEQPEGFA